MGTGEGRIEGAFLGPGAHKVPTHLFIWHISDIVLVNIVLMSINDVTMLINKVFAKYKR